MRPSPLLAAALTLALLGGATALVVTRAPSGDRDAPREGPSPTAEPDGAAPADLTELTEEDLTSVLEPDSIPSIDEPKFRPVEKTSYLVPTEPVVALEVRGDARAYPLQILTWHEIVNDEVGGVPVAITYCPLCNSALAFDRRVGGRVLEFGTSGSLYNSALVMYDRQTDSRWLHFEGLAVIGELEGRQLDIIPVQLLSFETFAERFPDGRVLTRDTGVPRSYGTNPYDRYDSSERPFLFRGDIDERMAATARVVGIEVEGEAVAVPYDRFSGEAGVASTTVDGEDFVVLWKPGVRSALDTPDIASGRDVGTSGVFRPEVGGRTLTFAVNRGEIVDEETGSRWSITGRAFLGPLAEEELTLAHHLDTFWFAWAAHHPETAIL